MTLQTQLSTMLSVVNQSLQISDSNFIGIFLYGSQNYQLDSSDSDMDTILLIKSSNKPKQEIPTPIGKIKVYTLKYFIYRLKQGDLECYEILYTKYKIINQLYESIILQFIQEFTECLNYEKIKNSLNKKLNEHMCHILWMIQNKENARYNKKRLYWSMRVCNQLERIIEGESFKSSLIYKPLYSYDLIKIKTITNYLSLKEFNEIYKYLVNFIHSLPKYEKTISDKEEKCLSEFYKNLEEK